MKNKNIFILLLPYSMFIFFSTIIVGVFISKSISFWIYGLLLGYINAVILFWDLKRTIELAVELDQKSAKNYAIRKYLFRYLISGIVIYISIRYKSFNTISTIVGLINIKLAIQLRNIISLMKGGN